jgi:hypothetical protein
VDFFSKFLPTSFRIPNPLRASRRPMLPKQTQEQNNTLRIQIAPSMFSLLIYPPRSTPMRFKSPNISVCSMVELGLWPVNTGLGIISGVTRKWSTVPVTPTAVERMKPGFERSIRYQRTGFTKASVRDAWRVEVQGSLRYNLLAEVSKVKNGTFNCISNPHKATHTPHNRRPVRAQYAIRIQLFISLHDLLRA